MHIWGLKRHQERQEEMRARGNCCGSALSTAWVGFCSKQSLPWCRRSACAVLQADCSRVYVCETILPSPWWVWQPPARSKQDPRMEQVENAAQTICSRCSALLVPSGLFGEPNSVSFPQLCWECPAMPGPVCTSGFTSQGVSQASCANQQFMSGLESGCAQDMGCANG